MFISRRCEVIIVVLVGTVNLALSNEQAVSGLPRRLTFQAINQEHRAAGSFTVELFTWDKISTLLRQYPEIEQQFHGGFRSEEVADFKATLEAIRVNVRVYKPHRISGPSIFTNK
jgi:hypothetical protein